MSIPHAACTESIGAGREPGELKHLSSRRKRKKRKLKFSVDFQSSGERNGKSPNRVACNPGFGLQKVSLRTVERFWESLPKRVKAPYTKSEKSWQYPEYIETRETLME